MLHKEKTGSVLGFPACEVISPPQLLALECDILIPAALDVIHGGNAAP
jgi:glutamate dehydrogenase/leucine dehydrogenase